MTQEGILHGIRVLDLSHCVSGSYCTMMLADHGAEVVKIEPPGGDAIRGVGPFRDDDPERDWAGHFVALNRNKKSVLVDLKSDDGKAAFLALSASADVVVESFGPEAMGDMGLGYTTLAQTNPALVYAAMCGLMLEPGVDTEQAMPKGQVATETFAGALMSFGIMAALRQAEATGRGQVIDVGNYETLLSLNAHEGFLQGTAGTNPTPEDLAAATLTEVPHPSLDKNPWKVAANPLSFSGFSIPATKAPPRLGEHTDTYLAEMPPAPKSDVDKRALRDVFGAFATGVTVVTTRQKDSVPRGFTANSLTSVSLDPPMLLICIAKTAHSCDAFMDAPHFAVNILSEDQKPVSGLFASQVADKFDQTPWRAGTADMPLLEDTLAGIVCEREKLVDAGDHVVLLGRVIDHHSRSAKPLGYFQGNYFSVGLDDELVSAATQSGATKIGAVLNRGTQVLLGVDQKGKVTIPKSSSSAQSLPNLRSYFEKLGLRTQLDFLYAVYHDTKTDHHNIYYHGTAVGLAPPGHKFFDLKDIPLDDFANEAERSLMVRYREEFQHGSFGIYQGDERSGIVHPVDGTNAAEYST